MIDRTDALQCEKVRSGYGSAVVVQDISLSVGRGEVFALVGKNGAGKTTLIRTLIGSLPLWSGTVKILGHEVSTWDTHRIMNLPITCAPQDNALFSDLPLDVNLRLGCLKLTKSQYRQALEMAIDIFPFIRDKLRQKAGTLSGGEQGMVKLARAIMPAPEVIILDEITEGLNPMMVNKVISVLADQLSHRNITIVLVEQHLSFIMQLATRYGLVARGALVGQGSIGDEDAQANITKHLMI